MSESAPPSQAPRIAIKFGASSSSTTKSTNGTKRPGQSQPPSSLGKRQRPHALNHHSDSDDDDDDNTGRHEVITSLGADLSTPEAKRRNAAATKSGHANAPYVIGGHKNRDWKAELKAQKGPRETGNTRRDESRVGDSKETEPADQDKQIKWGLNVAKKTTQEDAAHLNNDVSRGQGASRAGSETEPRVNSPNPSTDDDKDAINALLGKKRNPAKDLVIEGSRGNSESRGISEQDSYQRGMQEAAEVSTIDEYNEIPEGEFGAAMLRGMGWKGEDNESKLKEVKRRPHLMGLGSKEDEEIRKGELARKHGHRERRPRLDEYKRDREKQRRDRDERHRDSYKSERERDRRSDHRHGDRHRDRDSHRHRG